MRPTRQSFSVCVVSMVLLGCAATKPLEKETPKEALNAWGAVAGAISKQEMDEKKMKEAANRLQTDEETQSAVKAISESLEGKSSGIKYSPVTGKRYSAEMEYDPETGVKLVPLE